MPYEYGSQRIAIRNPFRFEGAAYAARAAVLVVLALYLMLHVKDVVAAGKPTLGWVQGGGGIVLLGLGLVAAGQGLFKLFRFYVGRGMPADLARTISSEQSVMPGQRSGGATGFRGFYELAQLEDMLLARKNPTFYEPNGWLERLLHSLAGNLLFLPAPLRNDAYGLFVAITDSVVLVVLLALAWFSGVTGLTPITQTPVMGWLVCAVTALLLLRWLRTGTRSPAGIGNIRYSVGRLALAVGVAILLPVVLSVFNAAQPLPSVPLSPYPWFYGLLLGTGAAFAYALVLALRRTPKESPPTDVAEYRQHWQESVHPMDIFRAVEMTLAKHRYEDIPNRLYESRQPDLQAQGSQNKGQFEGSTLQEIQPQPVADRIGDPVIRVGVVIGQALLLAAGACLFAALLSLTRMSPTQIAHLLLATLLCWIVGAIIARSAHLYLSEIEFASDLIALKVTGTFSESRVATGMSIYDSTRSENLIVRSSLTPWLLVSRVHSSTLSQSGGANLEQPRYVLGMERNEGLSRELVQDLQAYLHDRQIMADLRSEGDLQAASTIYQMNERTRAHRDNGGAPQISNEMRDDQILAPGGAGATDPGLPRS